MRIGTALVATGVVLAVAAPAHGATFDTEVRFADPSVVGTTGIVGTIELEATGLGGQTLTVFPGSLVLTPSCSSISDSCATPELGVFSLGSAATGAIGTDCQGITFAISEPDPDTGAVAFTTEGPFLLDGSAPGGGRCAINFVYSTLKLPTVDPDVLPGAQTYQLIRATGSLSGGGFHAAGSVSEVTVEPAPVVTPPVVQSGPAPAVKPKRKCKRGKKLAGKKRKCARKTRTVRAAA
jgi:hypothetical protein